MIQIVVWQKFALSNCLEYDVCLLIFDGEEASQDGDLNEWSI